MSDEVKIVIQIKGEKAVVGIGSPDCDPVSYMAAGPLETVAAELPRHVQEAKDQWEKSKLYPKAPEQTPPPTPEPVPVSKTTTVTSTAKKGPPLQPKFDL